MDQITRNKNMYDVDLSKHDCGYWSVCDDRACPCSIDKNIDGFSNKAYEEMKDYQQKIIEEFYSDY